MSLVNRRRMQADRLIIRTISKSFSISYQKLWVEAPSNDRAGDNVIIAVNICSLGYLEELTASARESSSELLVAHIYQRTRCIPIKSCTLCFRQRHEPGVDETNYKLAFQIFDI